ncbi:DUF4038 domain-containing protein [Planctomycetota bacterium]
MLLNNNEAVRVECWKIAEIDLVSARVYDNPYRDVSVSIVFTGPEQRRITRDAFWYGKNLWKVRFAPTAAGTWTWKTSCSDAANDTLHGRTGSIACAPYTGTLPIFKRGFIRASDDGRHFTYDDGTPFFWLGDTHWQMPDTERLDECNHPDHGGKECSFGGQLQHLAADRKARGFTVYQTYPSAGSPAWWTSRHSAINPERFAAVFDRQMDHLAAEGFVVAMGCGHFNSSTNIPVDDLRRWARYLVARYGAHPVVWITCQEMNAPEDDGKNRIDVWQAVAKEIEKADGYGRPHSGHQWVLDVGARPLSGESWHDWFALQGGHRNSGLTPQARYAGYYAFKPTRPVLETEAMYENIDCGGVADADDVRMSAWKAMLCGCTGYTYGAAGVWALKWDPADSRWEGYNYKIDGWYAGMALPGAGQMSVLKNFFVALPWTTLTPRFTDRAWGVWKDAEQCVLATAGSSLYVAYCYGKTSKGTLKKLDPAGTYRARWFDPRKGEYTKTDDAIRPAKGEWDVPEKPDAGDWALVVQEAPR